MVNLCELLLNVVIEKQPKMLRGCDQKGEWSGVKISLFLTADVAPPAKRQDLTRSGIYAERGKPVISLLAKESWLQGKPMRLRAEETGESERRAVMTRIRIEILSGVKTSRLPSGLY